MSTAMSTGTTSNYNTAAPLRATTIGTVVVRCGPVQLVIALLQVSCTAINKNQKKHKNRKQVENEENKT